MAAPPGKTLIRLADGRTIAVASEDAARYDYFSQDGKIMRRPKMPAQPPAARPPPSAPQAPPPRPSISAAPPPPVRAAPPPPPYVPPAAPPRPAAPAPAPPPPPPPPRPAAPPPVRQAPPRRRPMPIPLPVLGYNARVIMVTLALILLVFSPVTYPVFQSYGPLINELGNLNPSTFNQRTFPQTSEFDLTRQITLAAAANIRYNLTVSVAPNLADRQTIMTFTQSPLPSGTGSDGRMFWNRTMNAGNTESVQTIYHVKMNTYQWLLKPSDVGTAADVPASYAKYLDTEWKIDPTLPAVQNLANSITNRSANYLQQLDDLYTWLLSHYTYQHSPTYEPKAPQETMSSLGGDCDDFSVLFISMARYLGIPAWLELGLLYDEFRKEWGAHGWATVYIPLNNGTGVEVTIDVVNRLFLIRDPYHFSDWSSDGDAGDLQNYYVLLRYEALSQAPGGLDPLTVTEQITSGPMTNTGAVNYFHG